MKWAFLLALPIFTAVLAGLLRSKPRYLPVACFALGVSIFAIGPTVWAAIIPWPIWPGPVKGLILSYIDGVSIALIASTGGVRIPWSIKLPFILYCFAACISVVAAYQWEAAFFSLWQLLRTALLFVAIARVSATVPRATISLVAGLGLGIVFEGGYVIYQYMTGDPRPGGNLEHSNFLGLATDFVVFPAMALLVGTRRLWPITVVVAGLVIAILGGSRATLGLYAVGLLLTLLLSLQHGTSPRKFAFGGAAALLLIASVPVIMWAAHRRSAEELESSDAERDAMKLAATLIFKDHPLGVGANQYVVVANTQGYSQRAGVVWNYGSRSAPVHDTYYLVAAELGALGLVGFVGLIGGFILVGFRSLRRRLGDESNELVPGLLATMIIVAVHISYEWVFMHFMLQYLFAVAAGSLVGIFALQRAQSRTTGASRARATSLVSTAT